MKLFFFLLLILYFSQQIYSKVISIPFKYKTFDRKYMFYHTKKFLEEYFNYSLILELNIGTPFLKIDCLLNTSSSCFTFSNKDLKDKPFINDYYYPSKSSSYQLIKGDNTYDLIKSQELFNFNNNENYELNFLLKKNNISETDSDLLNYKYLPEIGLNIPLFKSNKYNSDECQNLIYDLKAKKIFSENIFTIKYDMNLTKEEKGEFIIGEDLLKYDLNYSNNYEYIKLNLKDNFSFEINSIFAENNTENYISKDKKREARININTGFIIGTDDFMNYIEDIYFGQLIKDNICKKELIKIENIYSEDKENSEYYIYKCFELSIKGKGGRLNTINYYELFPKIIFSSHILGKNFELNQEDLFRSVFERLYFLIIFKFNNNTSTNKKEENEIWDLGQPFFKKYPFSVNYDSKTLGFYFKKDEKILKNKIQMMENNEKIKKIIKYIGIIIISFGALYFAYYIGLKAREKRRKRANEMKDDDYEYIPEVNKDINEADDKIKGKKFMELNTKF